MKGACRNCGQPEYSHILDANGNMCEGCIPQTTQKRMTPDQWKQLEGFFDDLVGEFEEYEPERFIGTARLMKRLLFRNDAEDVN